MKKHFLSKMLLPIASGIILLGFSSCEDDDTGGSSSGTIANIVVSADNFSTLESAVVKANLSATLNGAGPFTVFAPDNAAFTASGVTSATINLLTPAQLSTILLYHTIPSKILAANVPAGPNAKVITASGDSVFVTRNTTGVYVNGVKVTQADINASNGVIHVIGRVLMPPVGNTVVSAQAPGSGLDSLVKAVVRASGPGGDPTILTTLQSSTVTVFAPNNAAFTQLLGTLGTNNIDNIPVATLVAVLKYHLVAGRAFSSDLANGSLTMVAGGSTTINLTNGTAGGPTITGSSNVSNKANIVMANMMTTNGVVHVIDKVLMP